MIRRNILIMGAAGRDFHNFNVCFRRNPDYRVVAFTAAQIPNIDGRIYPPELAGPYYPDGIPIEKEERLPELIRELRVDAVALSYSDLSHQAVMEKAALVNACGADFVLPGPRETMVPSRKPIIAVTAVRTGCGKSQTVRRILDLLRLRGRKVISVRHPMPYGDLKAMAVQRFATHADLDAQKCTIEEREEYEPHIDRNAIVYSGVDYEAILHAAEDEDPDVILWDGGNNDYPFYEPDLWITVADPHRAGHEATYYPGLMNLMSAQVVVINKIDSANGQDVEAVRANITRFNPNATVIDAASPLSVDHPELIRGARVLVVEDGPTVTHGEMPYGAGALAAKRFGASVLCDPRGMVRGSLPAVYAKYPHLGPVLPAMGYGEDQVADLQDAIADSGAEVVVCGTPIDLRRVLRVDKPLVRVTYELQEIGKPDLGMIVDEFLDRMDSAGPRVISLTPEPVGTT